MVLGMGFREKVCVCFFVGRVVVVSLALRACAGVVVVISFKEGFAFNFFRFA